MILSFLLRVGAVASFAEPALAAMALIAAHAGARATMPVFMRRVPRARQDGSRPMPGCRRRKLCLGSPDWPRCAPSMPRTRRDPHRLRCCSPRARPDGVAQHQADRGADRRRARRDRAGQRNPDPSRRRGVALSAYFALTVEVMEEMTSEAILNSFSRLVMP